ncbi:hypothetical protein DFH08DRAFT_978309 [Mycena albidolilacea]|uniref:Epoxide hydrolase N-terminal domain-containing protein n=1 Tax=Mycena albidolilacea TaxID=1033008 RepID=A0AAD7E8K3_9AGAR|nr:hypothetical protein DFH08DRAFT_978309 [Mycena albidolilacea]
MNNTRLPDKALYPDANPEKGIELDVLRELQGDWLINFDWEAQRAELNQPAHPTVLIEGILCIRNPKNRMRFLSSCSTDGQVMRHSLTFNFEVKFMSASGKNVSFNVVVPSLPEFVFSSAPPANWTTDDTAKILNTLMTEVLG